MSTFAPQALILMNGPFVQEQGKGLAIRLVKEFGADPTKQVDALYRRTVGPPAAAERRELAAEFLKDQAATIRDRLRRASAARLADAKLPEARISPRCGRWPTCAS